ncbi:MAG: hypothetical protein IJT94_00460 [Oscillibacter sp.]|nr:hypothetical protein [Oscillibacter sp.]
MQNSQGVQLAGYERLVEVLRKVPPTLVRQVDERAAIFVSGMEAMSRMQSNAADQTMTRPGA